MTRELVLCNRQRTRSINLRLLRRVGLYLLEEVFQVNQFELAIHLISVKEITRLNCDFLQHEGCTDVIAFDYSATDIRTHESPSSSSVVLVREALVPRLRGRQTRDDHETAAHRTTLTHTLQGEIFICVGVAVLQARQFHATWQSELIRYVIHGLLHLRGYNDVKPALRRVMKREENRLLRELSNRFSFAKLTVIRRRAQRKQPGPNEVSALR